MNKIQGFTEQGNTTLAITGAAGTIARKVQGSFPSCTVTVYLAGTLTLASIYSDDNAVPTAKANPFTAGTDGTWFAYATNGHYDIKFSGGGLTAPFTIGDLPAGIGASGVPSYAFASLPTAKIQDAGNLARVTDNLGSLWMNNGVQWAPVYPVLNAAEFQGADWVAQAQAAHDSVSLLAIIDMRYLSGTSPSTLAITKNCVFIFPNGTLTSTAANAITIGIGGVVLAGAGSGKSTLRWNPSGAGTCIAGSNSGSALVYVQIRGLTIDATGNTQTKVGVDLTDVNECIIKDFSIANFSNAGKTCNGIRVRGRQTMVFERVSINCDQPVRLSVTPNTNVVACDHFTFRNCYLIADASQPCWLIDSDVWLTNCTWSGYQAWVGGTRGIFMDGAAALRRSYNVRISDFRWEQAGSATGYALYVIGKTSSNQLYVNNGYTDSGHRGLLFRNWASGKISNFLYDSATGVAIDINSTDGFSVRDNIFNVNAGATVSRTGFIGVWDNNDKAGSGDASGDVEFNNITSRTQIFGDGTAAAPAFARTTGTDTGFDFDNNGPFVSIGGSLTYQFQLAGFVPGATNTYPLGASGNRFSNLFTVLANLTSYMTMTEIADPGVGAADTVRLYARDNGAGKTQLVCVFSSGAVQVIATQP